MPARAQLPAVDNIADQIDRLGLVATQEVKEAVGLATARAEVNIRDKESTEPTRTGSNVTMFDLSSVRHATAYKRFRWQRDDNNVTARFTQC